ncbi:acetylglutamate kinase [candidate division KSB3 bacterium]|uniref:Acetylglutamate kinase n=1 Tax=candidate division KSB3 bacterium TaxID=2044937 RepID=A0A2G6E3H5_9BACT|nr:MAG: acetylglutamate kinase [candidate division KSB3 bacterium]PIE28919.1 MAG: acetylglutamate kinase [candidate division KSB3 bacterium]
MRNRVLTEALIEALPYIRKFSGKIVVIKYGGAAMIDAALKESFAQDVSLLQHLGMQVVIVHGGGRDISDMAEKLNIQTEFVQGKRVTNEAMLELVKMVLAGKVNKEIVCTLNRQDVSAVGISGQDGNLLKCRKYFPDSGEDIGWVGEIVEVNSEILRDMLDDGFIPVIAPIGYDDEGNSYNINADSAAGSIAAALAAEKLIYLSDVPGVLLRGERIASVTEETGNAMIAGGEIRGGMIPKLNSAFDTLHRGVKKVHMLDGRVEHSMLVEIYTDSGIGTQFLLEEQDA